MTRDESKLVVNGVERLHRRFDKIEGKVDKLATDVERLKSFKAQAVAWATGAATAATSLGLLSPRILEWLTNHTKQ